MGSKPSAPATFDAKKTANRQVKYDIGTEQRNIANNRLDQSDQFDNTVDYYQTGVDAKGNPTYAVRQKLGEMGQQAAGGLSQLGQIYYGGVGNFLNNPADYTNAATEARIAELGERRLDPRFAREEAALRTRLANMGHDPRNIGPESAYDAEMERFNQGKNDAYNQLAMNARGQAFNEALQSRQAQLAEFQGLTLPGVNAASQFFNPHYTNVPGVNTQNVDYSSLAMAQQQSEMQKYQQELAAYNAKLAAAGQIGGAVLMAPMTGGGSLAGALGGAAMGGLSSLGGSLFRSNPYAWSGGAGGAAP